MSLKKIVLRTLLLALVGAAGCASQPAAAPPAPAIAAAQTPPAQPPPVEVQTALKLGGPQISVFHPDTRTLYLWTSVPDVTGAKVSKMQCFKVQMGDSPSGGPMTYEPCS